MGVQDPSAAGAPRQLFPHGAAQRVALARRQFFEEGLRPTGIVGEAVIQSWMRCLAARHDPSWRPGFQPVTPSRAHAALGRSRELLDAARDDLDTLEASLAGTDCRAILIDRDGVVIHATQVTPQLDQPILRTARVGVDLAESLVGTTAPGVVAKSGQAVTVMGGEHFYESLAAVECAAAPICDAQGQLAGVLDLSVEGRHFGFHAASMVGLFATRIENRLLQMQSREHLLLRFQADPGLLGTPLEALAGIGSDGRVCWLNGMATRLVGALPEGADSAERMFGLTFDRLLALTRRPPPSLGRLPSGLGVWVQAQLQAPDGVDFNHALAVSLPAKKAHAAEPEPAAASATEPPATLEGHSHQLIESTLAACGGNISRAARQLGVSRGLLYRRLRDEGSRGQVFRGGTGKSRG
ncbi:MAG TPA: helix-turn-helix domain-containing protein [Burkholderiaceae bacterium]|nr:helix-turn-helix domain-containing protein [Burkholderiaceae bacterium]